MTSFYFIVNNLFNGYIKNKRFIYIPMCKQSKSIVLFFYSKGIISHIMLKTSKNKFVYCIFFNYINGVKPLYTSFKFISKPSKRIYISNKSLKIFLMKYNSCFVMVSTRLGYLSLIDCYNYKIGGELLLILK